MAGDGGLGLVPGLSIVLPAYNEEPNIVAATSAALETGERLAREYEVIVVDDGSHDETSQALAGLLAERHPNLRLLRHPMNRGYGAALRTGIDGARFDYVFYTDADNQFDVAELEYLLPLLQEADVVTGFRVYRYDPTARLVASWGYNLLVRLLFRVRVRDVDCSFKLFRREVLDRITIECENFFVDTELIAKARKWNFRVVEKGVRHYPRTAGETTVLAGDIPRTLREVIRMWQRIHLPTKAQLDAAARIAEGRGAAVEEIIPSAG